jgi:hypothetical protein
MKQSRSSASREILRFVLTPKLYPLVHKCPPLVMILSQISLIHATFVTDSTYNKAVLSACALFSAGKHYTTLQRYTRLLFIVD